MAVKWSSKHNYPDYVMIQYKLSIGLVSLRSDVYYASWITRRWKKLMGKAVVKKSQPLAKIYCIKWSDSHYIADVTM